MKKILCHKACMYANSPHGNLPDDEPIQELYFATIQNMSPQIDFYKTISIRTIQNQCSQILHVCQVSMC